MPTPAQSSRSTPTVAVGGAVLIVAYAVLGAFQIMVLNPMAVKPGLSLAAIHSAMAARDEVLDPVLPLVFAGVGVLLAVAVVVLAFALPAFTTEIALMMICLILMFGSPAYWIASFGPGMSLADAFATTGADHSPWATPLYVASAAGLICLITLVVRRALSAARRIG